MNLLGSLWTCCSLFQNYSFCLVNIFSIVTQEDAGSPLTKTIIRNNKFSKYIIGIAFHRYESETGTYLRFIRIRAVLSDIANILKKLDWWLHQEQLRIFLRWFE